MRVKKYPIIIIILVLHLYPVKLQAVESKNLQITTQEECLALSGIWNICPKNECQKTKDYQEGKIICPEVCGTPLCEGILPDETEDLSEIHNAILEHNPNNTDNKENQDLKIDANVSQGTNLDIIQKNILKSIEQNRMLLYLTTGLLIIILFLLIKRTRNIKGD